MKKKPLVVVLGAGMVGAAMARDLAPSCRVRAVDRDAQALARLKKTAKVEVREEDLASPRGLVAAVADADLVVGAVPGWMGFRTLETVLECGKSCADISFFPEDPFALDKLARRRGVSALVDCGVAPGLSNLILGHEASQRKVTRFDCMVGGLPLKRVKPWEYKAPFSPADVLEEYSRPARLVEHGRVVVKEALSECELVELPRVGTLEAFNTDGLRTLLHTMKIPDMREKTLRYPGHAALMGVLARGGFFGTEEMTVRGVKVRPLDVASKLLFPQWKLGDTEEEFTVMRIRIEGGGTSVWDLFDTRDKRTGISSMARTTGYTCTAVARLLLTGKWKKPGIAPLELVGRDRRCFHAILADLKVRGITFSIMTT